MAAQPDPLAKSAPHQGGGAVSGSGDRVRNWVWLERVNVALDGKTADVDAAHDRRHVHRG